ncbi:MAG: polymer-forming cytoskeletal protein [Bacteroidetes bacterium]|nr:MAG: polymer-forming cytoskeletal protein [Bacteroidota bacterium]
MFNNKESKVKSKAADISREELNLIGVGTTITGDINSGGDLRIDGTVRGNVNSKARLVLGPNGKIEGDIQAQNADVQGSVKGKVMVSEILFLKATALINGDIITNKLVVENGAEFNGNCVMKSGSRILDDVANGSGKAKAQTANV